MTCQLPLVIALFNLCLLSWIAWRLMKQRR